MQINLHKNARTTPAQRAFIQNNPQMRISELAMRIGVSETTIRRWKNRSFVYDKSHTPHNIRTSLTPEKELAAVLLRNCLRLGLDDLHQVIRRFVFPKCSRSGLNRCLKRYGVSRLPSFQQALPVALNDYRGTFFYYTNVFLSGSAGQQGPLNIQVLMDYSFRVAFADISRLSFKSGMFFLNKVISQYPLSVRGIIYTDSIVLFDSDADSIEPDRGQEALIKTYCRVNDLVPQYLKSMTDATLNNLRNIWSALSKKRRNSFMNQLDSGKGNLLENIWTYNTRLPLRTLRRKTPIQSLQGHYLAFPGSFRQDPKQFYEAFLYHR